MRITSDGDIETIQDSRIMWRHQAGGTARASIEAVSDDALIFKQGSSLSETARINSAGHILHSPSGWNGTLASSDTGQTGNYIIADGRIFMQTDYNSVGGEVILVNNIHSSGASAAVLQYRTQNGVEGTIQGTSSGLAIVNASDYRKKENIADATGCLNRIKNLRPVTYTHRSEYDTDTTTTHTGFIAHEVADHLPSIVSGAKDAVDGEGNVELQGIAYSHAEMIANLVGALKEAAAKIETLETKVATLEGE